MNRTMSSSVAAACAAAATSQLLAAYPPGLFSSLSYGTERVVLTGTSNVRVVANRDGRPGAVVSFTFDGRYEVLGSTGNFLFSHGLTQTFANGFGATGVGDVNGDGLKDLVFGPSTDGGTPLILLQNESGGLTPAANAPFQSRPTSRDVVFGDFNADGFTDLAMSNNAEVFVHDGLGNGEYAPAQTISEVSGLRGIAAGQLDDEPGDELMIGTTSSSTIYTRNAADGAWSVQTQLQPFTAEFYAIVDLDSDGVNEVVVAGGNPATVQTLKRSDSGWLIGSAVQSEFRGGSRFLLDDLDADGFLDAVTTGEDAVSVFFGSSTAGGFGRIECFPTRFAGHGEPVLAFSSDPSGRRDIAFIRPVFEQARFTFLRNSVGGFGPTITTTQNIPGAISLVAAYPTPIDGKTVVYLKAPERLRLYRAAIDYGPSGVEVSLSTDFAIGSDGVTWFGFHDIDGTGTPDYVAIRHPQGSNAFIDASIGDGLGNFGPVLSRASSFSEIAGVGVGDFNADGRDDVAVASGEGNAVEVYFGTQISSPAEPVLVQLINTPATIAVGDFDDDGYSDIMVSTRSGAIEILYGDSQGSFTDRRKVWMPIGITPNFLGAVAVADFNGDWLDDLCFVSGDDLLILYADADRGFDPDPLRITSIDAARSVLARDLNGDARPEIIAFDFIHRGTLFQQDVAGGYELQSNMALTGFVRSAQADINGDGQLDIIAVDAEPDFFPILFGRSGRACIADHDRNARVDWLDIGAFLSDFNAGNRFADLTSDRRLDFHDIARYIHAYIAGCPE